jgi:hypothetical protein
LLDDMTAAFSICRQTGDLRIGNEVSLSPYAAREAAEPSIAPWLFETRDMGNGYAWLKLRGVTFGGQPASLALCFNNDRLAEASWSVQLPSAPEEDGWPSREAIDAEIAFVGRTLATEMGLAAKRQPWGSVWSVFDPKGYSASNGVRYDQR